MKGVRWICAADGSIVVILVAICSGLIPGLMGLSFKDEESRLSWVNHGGSLSNRRDAPFEKDINRDSVTKMSLKWTARAKFSVSSTPAVDARLGVVYFSSWDGCQYAVKKDTAALVWKVNLTELATSIPGLVEGAHVMPMYKNATPSLARAADIVCRTTPTIAGRLLVFGIFSPCYMLALDRATGALVWWTSLDTHPVSVITQSATYFRGALYVGTSSQEEAIAECCTFQGAFLKLDAKTGKMLWRVPMIPDNHNRTNRYAGVAIWGSSPPIDLQRRLVYIATGNTYSVPADVEACEEARLNQTNPPVPDPCLAEDNYAESMLAIEIDTGRVAWSRRLGGYDTWTFVCQQSPVPLPNCPKILGEDYDFGEAPFLLRIEGRDIAVAGQKSGIVHALDRSTGDIVWQADAGPGGILGGAMWGMTTDGERVFTNIANSKSSNFTLFPSSAITTGGGWVGINGTTGAILWSTASPALYRASAPMAYTNGVVFGGSEGNSTTGDGGEVIALDPKTGSIIWSYKAPGGVVGGISILDGCIFQPIGYTLGSYQLSTAPVLPEEDYSTIALCVPPH